MNRILTAALGAALAVASASAAAADTGAFFINGGVGQAQYHVGRTDGLGYTLDEKDTAGALRFGYAWKVGNGFDLGVEGGYTDLGKVVSRYYYATTNFAQTAHADANAKGWLLGGTGRYNFADNWFVSARAGWFRSTVHATANYSQTGYGSGYASGSADGDGWYGGVGVGYDFAPNFSMGLNYDNYHVKGKTDAGSVTGNVGSYMLSAEYRF